MGVSLRAVWLLSSAPVLSVLQTWEREPGEWAAGGRFLCLRARLHGGTEKPSSACLQEGMG